MAGEDVSMQDVTDQGEKEEPRVIDTSLMMLSASTLPFPALLKEIPEDNEDRLVLIIANLEKNFADMRANIKSAAETAFMPSSQLKPQSGPTHFSEADHDRQRIEMAALLSAPISADMEYGIKPGENHRSGTKRTASGTVKPDEDASVTTLRTAVSKRDALLLEHEMLVEKTMKQYRDSLARKRGLPIPPETTNIRRPGATATDVTITTSTKSELPPLTRSSTLPNDHATSIQSVGVTRANTLPMPPPASPTRASTLPMPALATSIRPAPSESPHLYSLPPKFLPAPTRPESEPRPRPMLQPVSQDPRRRLTTQSPASAISPLTLNSAAVPPPTDPRRRTVMQSLPVDTGSTSVSTTSDPRRRPTASSGTDHTVQTRSNLPRLSTTSLACEIFRLPAQLPSRRQC